jgi:hypothetical protein
MTKTQPCFLMKGKAAGIYASGPPLSSILFLVTQQGDRMRLRKKIAQNVAQSVSL